MLWERYTSEDYLKVAANIRKLIDLSDKKGVNLILMIACDKYDAYEPWIQNSHPQNPVLDNIPKEKRIYISRDCLRDAIEKDIKDVYKLNNTHWSTVGADIVGNDLYEWMVNSNLLSK